MSRTLAEDLVRRGTIVSYSLFVGWAYLDMLVDWGSLIDWVYEHETLTTGFLAVGSAVVGSMVLHNQTTQSARLEARKAAARREAARLELPLALSAIGGYASDAAKATKSLLDQCVEEDLPSRAELQLPAEPAVPIGAISTLKEVAEAAHPAEVRPLAILVADIQVQASRLRSSLQRAGGEETLVVRHNLEEYIIDCALIYARAESLFAYARGSEAQIVSEVRWRKVSSALFHFGMWGQEYDGVRQAISRRCGEDLEAIVGDRWSARER